MKIRTFAGMTLLALLASPIFAQSTAAATKPVSTDTAPAFEIADIHTSPHINFPFMNGGKLRGDRYELHQATMLDMIASAYGVDNHEVQGGPSWLEWDRFDVIAKAPPSTTPDKLKLMLQSLLIDRFKLVTHNGDAPMPAYVLRVGKDKPKMKESEGTSEGTCEPQPPPANAAPGSVFYIVVSCHNMSMEKVAQLLRRGSAGYVDQPVIDSTGLKGTWDFDLKWTPRGQLGKAGADGITIFDALEKQLGLKLALETAPRSVLIVDSVNEKPSANPPGLEKSLPPLPPAQFEVAVIKPSRPDERPMGRIRGGQVDVQGMPLKFLISFAWNLNQNDSEVLVGAPKWLDEDHFDIMAKVSTGDSEGPTPKTAQADQIQIEELRQMIRALLEDRFKMKAHMEDRAVTAYTLMSVSPKLKAADPSSRTHCIEGPGADGKDPRLSNPMLNRLISCQNITMAQFSELLQSLAPGFIYSPVLDATEIKGAWDFTLAFSSADRVQAGPSLNPGAGTPGATPTDAASAASDPNGAISLVDAVRRQLGLKLEKQRRPAPVLVIEHLEEHPTEN